MEKRIQAIEERNKRVELDKAWETSWTRRTLVAIVTYFVIVLFFLSAGLDKPFINPVVPTVGYLLSTLTIARVKRWWVNHQ